MGAFWSAAEMVKWVGNGELDEAAAVLMKAIENVTAAGIKTKDLGGSSNTKEVTEAVCQEIEKVFQQ